MPSKVTTPVHGLGRGVGSRQGPPVTKVLACHAADSAVLGVSRAAFLFRRSLQSFLDAVCAVAGPVPHGRTTRWTVVEVEFFPFFPFPPCQRAVAGRGDFFFLSSFFFFPFFPLSPPCRSVASPVPPRPDDTTCSRWGRVDASCPIVAGCRSALPFPTDRIDSQYLVSIPSLRSPRKVRAALSFATDRLTVDLPSVPSFHSRSSPIESDWVQQWLVRSFPSQGTRCPFCRNGSTHSISPLSIPSTADRVGSGLCKQQLVRFFPSRGMCCALSQRIDSQYLLSVRSFQIESDRILQQLVHSFRPQDVPFAMGRLVTFPVCPFVSPARSHSPHSFRNGSSCDLSERRSRARAFRKR